MYLISVIFPKNPLSNYHDIIPALFNKEYKTNRIECDNHSRAFNVIPSYLNILIDDMKI